MTSIAESRLSLFHPLVQEWFGKKFGEPTDIQEKSWGLIASGEHALISAATGSGKTLAAFLWAINQLASGEWELGQTRVIYISPLKALNNDIRLNLLEPLAELKEVFHDEGLDWPDIRVMTRSGDTDQSDRRKMLRKPPEILITTPESLNLMLTSADGQRALLGVKSLILDEIHSVVGSKRGVYLMTAVERLAHLNGEFQRIALSATVRPMETVAKFVGGFAQEDDRFRPREVKPASSSQIKEYAIETRFPEEANEDLSEDDFWHPIVLELKRIVAENNSTLIFVNSRLLCEKIAHKINMDEPAPIAYSHHGSLSKEIRFAVEQRLKNGDLKAIVATNSLEMGIDIGALDRVIMVQCPGLVSSAIQKVGRAGHQVGAISQATLFPTHGRDFLEAAVLSKAIQDRDIEPVRPIECPLDVLAQIIVSMVGSGSWDIDELFSVIKCGYPYRDLQREPFDLVLNMLAGRYAASRLRELKPRISINRSDNSVTIRKGALLAYYFSGGVIPDRGYFHLRLEGPGSRIGELDEEFVWERVIGDVFTLGVQTWRIERITYNDVFVSPGEGKSLMPPFWRAEEFNRDFHYSSLIGRFLEWADDRVEDKDFAETLEKEYAFDPVTSNALMDHLRKQKLSTRQSLPHRRHILAELIDAAPSGAPGQQLVLHTHWGGRVNRPLGLALDAAWEEKFKHRTEVYVNNDCVAVMISEDISVDEVLRLVHSSNVEEMLRLRLENSGFFGARFREASGTALLITRQRAGQRLPLWLSRMRSKKLLDSVRRYDDFPIMLEAWRTCLKDEFDMESLKRVLVELEQGLIEISFTKTSAASPFAASVAWRQINDEYMYDSDNPTASENSNLREDLIRSVAFDDAVRPTISEKVIRDFEAKRQRLAPGYAPTDELELKEWLKDRIALDSVEWEQLKMAVGVALRRDEEVQSRRRATPTDIFSNLEIVAADLVYLEEEADRFEALFSSEPDPDLFIEWISYFGPVSIERIYSQFPSGNENASSLFEALVDERRLVAGKIVKGSDESFICEYENFETLLRMQRARNRPTFDPLPLHQLGLLLAERQGLIKSDDGEEGVCQALESLSGYVERATLWEEEFLPARVQHYQSSWLDSRMVSDQIEWIGNGESRLMFGFGDELDLVRLPVSDDELSSSESAILSTLISSRGGRFAFHHLLNDLGLDAGELEEGLWSLVWKGRISNDSFAAVRKGAVAGFSIGEATKAQNRKREATAPVRARMGRRTRMLSLVNTIMYPGNWYALTEIEDASDEIEGLEKQKERARILLDRYGVLFRELLTREAKGFQWKDVFKALRLMELSGEILSGSFFQDISGLQFCSQEAFRRLRKGFDSDPIYWINACDPASLCGIGLDALKGVLPKRLASSRIVFRGRELAAEVQRNGKSLFFHVLPEDEDMLQILEAIRDLFIRSFNPYSSITLELINDEDARNSPYLDSISSHFRLHSDHKRVVIEGIR